MPLFSKNVETNNEFRKRPGLLGLNREQKSGPVLRDVVSKGGNIIKLGEPLKKPVEVSKGPPVFSAAKPILEIKKEVPYRKLELPQKNVLISNLAKRPDFIRKMRSVSIIGSVLLFIVSVALFSFAFSRARLTIRVKIITVPLAETVITVDPKATAVNINTKRLPGLYIEATKSVVKNFEAKTVGYTESRARGMITIFNNFGTSPQTLIKTTRFESKLTGLVFRLQETITVPGAVKQGDKLIPGSIKTEVVADEIGEKYNIVSDDFVIPAFKGSPRYQGFYAKSHDAFRGGLKGAGAIVTADELKKAEEEVTAKAFEEARKELDSKIPPGYMLRNKDMLRKGGSIIKITKVSKPRAGEAVRTFTVAADAVASATLFKEDDLYLLLSKLVIKEGSRESILKQKTDINPTQTNFDFDNRLLTFNIGDNLVLSYDIDQERLKNEIGGKSKSEAEDILRDRPEFTGFVVEISPFWVKKVPSNPKKVDIKVEL